ncbi:MAG: hypothetical protein M1598_01135 [Actinobacteria bacterium]|nr:hypothetical protein [Actinomycetota bacterium]
MKKVFLVAALAAFVLGGVSIYGRTNVKAVGPYDVVGARTNARKFIGNDQATLDFKGATNQGWRTLINLEDNRYIVDVNSRTLEVESFFDKTAIKTGSPVMAAEQALGIATTFAQTHSIRFNPSKLTLKGQSLINHGLSSEFTFEWAEVQNGMELPNRILVTVDAQSGMVYSYQSVNIATTGPTAPQVTQVSAISLAHNQFSDKKVVAEKATLSLWPDLNGQQVLRWVIDMDFERPVNDQYAARGGQVMINAITGEVMLIGIK